MLHNIHVALATFFMFKCMNTNPDRIAFTTQRFDTPVLRLHQGCLMMQAAPKIKNPDKDTRSLCQSVAS